MAFSVTIKHWLLAGALLYFSVYGFKFGKAEEDHPHNPHIDDPAQIAAKALLCFNDKLIYSSCEEAYRLSQSGNIKVPHDYVDEYCSGPCLTETYLVLNCVDNILSNFLFYNKATIQDVRDTIHAGCGSTEERGNFNVAEHIEAEETNASKAAANPILFGLAVLIIGLGLFL